MLLFEPQWGKLGYVCKLESLGYVCRQTMSLLEQTLKAKTLKSILHNQTPVCCFVLDC